MKIITPTTFNFNGNAFGKVASLLGLFVLLLVSSASFGQSTFNWNSGATSGLWNTGGNWGGTSPTGSEIIQFNNNVQTSMTNDLGTSNRFKIIFQSGATTARTVGGSTQNTFFEFGSTWPRIENQSTTLHTINFPFAASTNSGFNMELAATSGSIDFGSSALLNNNGRTIQIYGNNTATDAANRAIRLGGVVSGSGILNVSQFGAVKLNATHTYTGQTQIDNGELWIESAGSISSSSSIFVGNGGQLTNVAKFWISNGTGGTTVSNNITINNGNSTTRYLGGLNSSGTNTFSGAISNNSTTGGLNLSALTSGGTTVFSGVISGSSALVTEGAGQVTLSGSSANTYTGTTTVNGTLLVLNKTAGVAAIPTATTVATGATLRTDAANQWGTGTPPLTTLNGTAVFNLNGNNQKVALASASSTSSVTLGSGTLNIDNTGTDTFAGVLSGTGSLSKTNTGVEILTNTANAFTGTTTITGGEVRLNPSANATYASQIVLSGGTLGTTGITSTRTWTSSSTLNLTTNSTIALASATAHTVTFAASNAVVWTSPATISVTGWSGSYNGTTGTGGKLFFGSTATGLTATQLGQILFFNGTNYFTAIQLSTGEVVPTATIALFWGGTGAWATATPWGLVSGGPYATAWTSARGAVFNVASSTITGATTVVSSITANENVTVSASGTMNTNATPAPVYVASGKTFTFGSQAIGTTAGTGFIKNGPGIFQLTGAAYTGGFTLNDGLVSAGGVNAMGSGGSLTINGGTIGANANRDFTGKYTGITIGGDFTLGSSSAPAVATSNLTFSDATALGSSATRTITLGGTGTYSWNGVISGTSSNLVLAATAAGTLSLGGANTYGGSTTINGGTLSCGVASALPSTTAVSLANTAGASLSLGTFNQTVASLAGGGTTGGNVSLGSATFSVTGASSTTFSGALSGTGGGLTLNNASAVLTLANAANAHTGTTIITAGELRLNPVSNATYASQIQLNGGKLSTTGIATSTTFTSSSTLNLNANSTLDLGTNAHTLTFAASNGVTWAGSTLVINNWTGTAGASGTAGKIFIGSTATGLTSGQLSKISFTGFGTATLLSTGELVPSVAGTVTIATNSVAAGNLVQNTTLNPIYSFAVTAAGSSSTLTGLSFTTNGTYLSADVTNLKCYYQASTPFSVGSATLLSTLTTPGVAGLKTFPSFVSQNFPIGTGYIFITADVPCAATTANTIAVNAVTASNMTFTGVTPTGTPAAGNTQTITAATPVNVTGLAASVLAASSSVSWTNPTGCFDEVMVVVAPAANTGTPTGNGSAYTANLTYASGTALGNGYVAYKGSTSPQVVTGLTNGSAYYYKIFTRFGSTWSAGIEVGPITPSVSYCAPSTSSGSTYISNVTTTLGLTNLNNTSVYTTGGYVNNTSVTPTVSQYPNTAVNFSVTIVGGTAGIAIYVDWNNNGLFTDSGEQMYTSNAFQATGATTGSFTVPSSQTPGNYTMRVITDFNATNPVPCSFSGTRGEAEDYKFTVTAPCTQPTTAATIGSYTANTTGTTLTSNWTRGNGTGGVIVVARLTATAAVGPTSGTTYTPSSAGAFGGTTTTGTGNIVIYNGTGTSQAVTGLTAGTSYTFTVYEYNTTSTCYAAGSSSAVTTCTTGTPSVSIAVTTGTNPACASTSITFTATPTNGGTPSYQWKLNGGNVGTNSSTYTNSALSNGDSVTCDMTNSAACSSNTVTSNAIVMTINAAPTTSNAGTTQTICANVTSVTLAANSPSVGTGAWSVSSGPSTSTGQFSSLSSPTATFTPAGGAGSYVLTWTISNSPCTASSSNVTITVNALPTSVTISSGSTICEGSIATLTASSSSGSSGTATIGTQSGTTNTNVITPYRLAATTAARNQYLYTKAELNAAGITGAQNITSLAFDIPSASGVVAMTGYDIQLANTTSTATASTFTFTGGSFTSVYSGSNITPITGLNTYTFTTPFAWDGTSNIIVNICFTSSGTAGTSQTVKAMAAAASNSSVGNSGGTSCSTSSGGTVNTVRPLITLGYSSLVTANITWATNTTSLWTDATANTTAYTNQVTGTVYANPSTTQTYTATATAANSCTTSNTVLVTVNPKPQGSLTANGPFCTTGAGQLTWTATAGTGPYTVVYNDGTANRTASSVTSGTPFNVFTTPVTSTTTYTLVSVTDANCIRTTGFTGSSATVTINPVHTISLTSGSSTPSLCINTALATNIVYTVGGGATGAGVTGLPSGMSGNFSGSTFTISGTPTASGTFNYTVTTTGNACTVATATGTITVSDVIGFANLQYPASGTICMGGTYTAYGQVYQVGVTPAAGQGSGITVQFGYNGTNTDPSTWTTWTAATYNTDAGNNDEYLYTFTPASSGTYYYTFRYKSGSCDWQYGGYNGGFWNGTTNINGVLTVNSNAAHTITLSSGAGTNTQSFCANTAIPTSITYTVGGGATGAGATGLPSGMSGSYSGGTFTISGTPTASGTFTYTVTTTGNGCASAVTATGTLTISSAIDFANLQYPPSGTVCPGGLYTTYGQVYEPGVTDSAGQGTGITVQFGYNSTNTDPATWTTWAAATYNTDSGNNDEYTYGFTPSTSGTYYYTFRYKQGTCDWQYGGYSSTGGGFWNGTTNVNGVLTVSSANTAGAASSSPTLCINSALTAITHTTTGATGIGTATGLPTGVTASWASNTITISGTPTASGTFNYTIPLTGGCGSVTATGTIIVRSGSTAAVISGGASICSGGSTNLSVAITGGASPFTVVYTGGSVSSYTSGSNISVSPSSTTTYTITSVTDANGCVGSGNSGSAVVNVKTTTTTDGGATWSNGTPDATKAIVYNGSTGTIGADMSGCSLSLINSALVTVSSGFNVTLSGAITVASGSTFTLNNNANLLQGGTTNTNSGNIVVKRNSAALKRLDYTLWSSPVAGQELYAFSPLTFDTRFYVYNPTTNLYNAFSGFNITGLNADGVNGTDGNHALFSTGTGYLIRTPWNHPTAPTVWTGTFTGVPNTGNITLSSLTSGKFYAIGNPYPSTISADQFITDNSIGNNPSTPGDGLYFWRKTNNATASSYATYTTAGGVKSGGDTLNIVPNGTIQVGEGFVVKTTSTSLAFNNGQRVANNADQFLRTATIERNRIWLNLSDSTALINQMMVAYMTDATQGIDVAIDGRYFNDNPTALNSFLNNEEFAIQGRSLPFDASDIVPLAFKAAADGTYTITLDHVDGLFAGGGQTIYLKDNLTNSIYDLSTGGYTFATTAGAFNTRFELVYQSALGVTHPTFTANNVIIYSQNHDFVVNTGSVIMSSVKVFDIRGRLLLEKKGINSNQTVFNGGEANQVLMVQITSENGDVVNKKVIR